MSSRNNTASRLADIYPFDAAILEAVEEVATRQYGKTFAEVLENQSVPAVEFFTPEGGNTISVLDIKPDEYEKVQVFHLPMGGSLNADRVMRVATLSATQPTTRLIAVGNPGEIGSGRPSRLQLKSLPTVWQGSLRPTIDSTMRYLKAEHIELAEHTGGSFGADKAVTAAIFAENYDQKVDQLAVLDPASVKKRTPLELLRAFQNAEQPLADYVKATDSAAYIEARNQGGGIWAYKLGLFRLSNLAISHSLTFDGFEERLSTALTKQESMSACVIWAEQSELCENGLMRAIVARTKSQESSRGRFAAASIGGQRHAMMNDIYLNAALTLTALKMAKDAQET